MNHSGHSHRGMRIGLDKVRVGDILRTLVVKHPFFPTLQAPIQVFNIGSLNRWLCAFVVHWEIGRKKQEVKLTRASNPLRVRRLDLWVDSPCYNLYEMFDRTHERRIGLSLNGGFFEGPITHVSCLLRNSLDGFGKPTPRPKCGWSYGLE